MTLSFIVLLIVESLVNNETWDFVQFLAGKGASHNKWVYRLKEDDGGENKYKERMGVKGFA
jgi:hypothetical protein